MGRRHGRDRGGSSHSGEAELERTMAAAEADTDSAIGLQSSAAQTRCICGSEEFILEAYLHVIDGVPKAEPVEVENLTCPKCGREFEGILGEGGRILRGDFLGFLEDDTDDE